MNEQVQPPGAGKRAKAVCAVAVFAVLGATLWPFNPFPANGVHWLHGSNGLKFERAGLVVSNEPLRPPETKAAESYTLGLLLSPYTVKS